MRLFLLDFLKTNPCVDCGEKDIIVLTFDHKNPDKKEFLICQAMSLGVSMERLKKEIKKCDVRCCNCHRRRTEKQFPSYKTTLIR